MKALIAAMVLGLAPGAASAQLPRPSEIGTGASVDSGAEVSTSAAAEAAGREAREREEAARLREGSIESGTYRNPFFGLTMPVGDDWLVIEKESILSLAREGGGKLIADPEMLKAMLEQMQARGTQLFMLRVKPATPPDDSEAIVLGMAETLPADPVVADGAAYLAAVQGGLAAAKVPFSVRVDPRARKIGGRRFDEMELEFNTPEGPLNYRINVALVRGDALLMTVHFKNEKGLARAEALFKGAKFR